MLRLSRCVVCGTGSPLRDPDRVKAVVKKFLRQIVTKEVTALVGEEEEVCLCEECLSGVGKAVEMGEQVREVERDVRSLQRIILKMMRQLTSLQGSYLEEMRRLEGKVKDKQEKSKKKGRGGGRRRKRGRAAAGKASVIEAAILKVVAEFGAFAEDICPRIPESGKLSVPIPADDKTEKEEGGILVEESSTAPAPPPPEPPHPQPDPKSETEVDNGEKDTPEEKVTDQVGAGDCGDEAATVTENVVKPNVIPEDYSTAENGASSPVAEKPTPADESPPPPASPEIKYQSYSDSPPDWNSESDPDPDSDFEMDSLPSSPAAAEDSEFPPDLPDELLEIFVEEEDWVEEEVKSPDMIKTDVPPPPLPMEEDEDSDLEAFFHLGAQPKAEAGATPPVPIRRRRKMSEPDRPRKYGPCQFCGQSFKKSDHFRHHMYMHTGERPYKCDLCPKVFRRLDALNRHLNIHSGRRPYSCQLCEAAFGRADHLDQHVKRKHNAV